MAHPGTDFNIARLLSNQHVANADHGVFFFASSRLGCGAIELHLGGVL